MKQLVALLSLTLCLSTAAFANNVETNGDPDKPEQKQEYTFSLSRGYLKLFNLFSVEPAKTDTISLDRRKLPHELSESE